MSPARCQCLVDNKLSWLPYSKVRGMGSDEILDASCAIKSNFHFRRWTWKYTNTKVTPIGRTEQCNDPSKLSNLFLCHNFLLRPDLKQHNLIYENGGYYLHLGEIFILEVWKTWISLLKTCINLTSRHSENRKVKYQQIFILPIVWTWLNSQRWKNPDRPKVLNSWKNETFICTCHVPRQNVVRGTRRRPHLSMTSSPDASAAVVELRGLVNLKQTSEESQNEKLDMYSRRDTKFLRKCHLLV